MPNTEEKKRIKKTHRLSLLIKSSQAKSWTHKKTAAKDIRSNNLGRESRENIARTGQSVLGYPSNKKRIKQTDCWQTANLYSHRLICGIRSGAGKGKGKRSHKI